MSDELAQSLDDFVLLSDGDSSGSPVATPTTETPRAETHRQSHFPHPAPPHLQGLLPLYTTYAHSTPPPPGAPNHDFPHFHGPHARHGRHGRHEHHGGPPLPGQLHGPPPHHFGPPGEHPLLSHGFLHRRHHRGHGDCDRSPNPSVAYANFGSAQNSNTMVYLQRVISASHPKAAVVATDDQGVDLLSFAKYPGNAAKATANSSELPGSPFVQYGYSAPTRRDVDEEDLGNLFVTGISWGRFDYTYKDEQFILYIAQWTEGFNTRKLQVLVHEPKKDSERVENSKKICQQLLLRASFWGQQLRDEVWVFDRGYWQKDAALFQGMMKANWDDVILPSHLKNALRTDIGSFFKNKATYDDIGIAWKRGIIMYGPPGNGKTISLKATMKELYYSFDISPIPTLCVRSLQSWAGEQEALRLIFEHARSVAPCMLVFEDLDSLINPGNRSYFLNQMDGLDDNNGILVVGTTNHLNELDPGIIARPSRFDRKYEFGLPGTGEGGRPAYVEYWRKKLENRPGIKFPESLVTKIVDLTDGFSFAYMKEAFVSALLLIAAREGSGDGKENEGVFERVIIQQLKNLRKQLGNE